MKKQENPNARNAKTIVAQGTTERKTFDDVKREFEKAYTKGGDYSAALYDLATAVAYSVLNKCIDPQRKTAPDMENVSSGGQSPALVQLRRGIASDLSLLDNTRKAVNGASHATFTADGDPAFVTDTPDEKRNAAAVAELMDRTLSDGVDLVQTAALAILEAAAAHADNGGEWLDRPYTARRLSRRVYIRAEDSAAYADVETSAIRDVFQTVRREIANSRAVQTDPRNGYLYLEELTEDGLETIYRRLGKFADLGGMETKAAPSDLAGAPAGLTMSGGHYTADAQTVTDYAAILERLELTDRQAQIVRLRMQGKGCAAIGTYLGITHQSVEKTLYRLRDKCRALGFYPGANADGDR